MYIHIKILRLYKMNVYHVFNGLFRLNANKNIQNKNIQPFRIKLKNIQTGKLIARLFQLKHLSTK